MTISLRSAINEWGSSVCVHDGVLNLQCHLALGFLIVRLELESNKDTLVIPMTNDYIALEVLRGKIYPIDVFKI